MSLLWEDKPSVGASTLLFHIAVQNDCCCCACHSDEQSEEESKLLVRQFLWKGDSSFVQNDSAVVFGRADPAPTVLVIVPLVWRTHWYGPVCLVSFPLKLRQKL
jgi:hypothetical protein